MLTTALGKYTLSEKKSSSQKIDKMLMAKPVLDAPAHQQWMKILKWKNRQITINEVVEDVGILVCWCQAIFSDVLRMKRVLVKFVLKF